MRDTYHGVTIDDPFRWLEGDGPDVAAWTAAQDRVARAHLDTCPDLTALRAEYAALLQPAATTHVVGATAGGLTFALRTSPAAEQPVLVALTDLAQPGAAAVVLDPTADGDPTRTIDWYVPSPDGQHIAVSLSAAGTEAGALHLVALDGTLLEPPIPNVQRGTGGGDAAWSADGRAIYYTRYPLPGEPHADEPDFWMQLRRHDLGTPWTSDALELGDLPRIVEIMLQTDARGRVLASLQLGDGGVFRHHLRTADGTWHALDDWDDAIQFAGFGATADLWLVSRKHAPCGEVLRLPAGATSVAAAVRVIAERPEPIVTDYYTTRGVLDLGERILVGYQCGGPSALRAFTRDGTPLPPLALPPIAAVGKPLRCGDAALVAVETYTEPRQVLRVEASGATTALPALAAPRVIDLAGCTVIREHATSTDGAAVPFSIVWPTGAPRDGSVCCIATGYGGFGISMEPKVTPRWAPLIARGFAYVEANLRGGGEFGAAWHAAGMRTRKQQVFDDFAAVLRALVERGYTQPARLGIFGSSNGGILIGAMITQHPGLAGAAIAEHGTFDMLRSERTENGSFVVPELGSVEDPAEFHALLAYSPYHRSLAGVGQVPPTLVVAGANDPRTAPWHSRKLVAALHAAGAPVFLRIGAGAGHGIGSAAADAIELAAHRAAFFAAHLR